MKFRTLLALTATLLFAFGTSVAWGGAAGVDQYTGGGGNTGTTTTVDVNDATGPLAGLAAAIDANGNGTLEIGEILTLAGSFSFEPGACITFIDGDSTIGTICDGGNGTFTTGSLIVEVTGAPSNVSGGDGVLDDSNLTVFASSGVTTGTADGSALPQTGGEFAWLIAGLLVLVGSGLALRRATRTRTEQG